MNIVLLSNHWYPSPRKAGFHHLADAWHAQGHTIAFVTVGLSTISWLRRDFRTRFAGIRQACNVWQRQRDRFDSYVLRTLWHPHTSLIPALDYLLDPFMRRYGRSLPRTLCDRLAAADAIVYESCAALYLVSRCRELAPQALHIYRVSDDIRTMRSTPAGMVDLEQRLAPTFSLISVPCQWLTQKFPPPARVCLHPHGLNRTAFDACSDSPYPPRSLNAVFCGLGFFDAAAVHMMAQAHPEATFHILGVDQPHTPSSDNVRYYGERPFAETIPYIKFADMGLYTLRPSSRPMQAYTDSLKIIQYRYCGLPIVSPDFLDLHREGVFYYTPGNAASCAEALAGALNHGRHAEYATEVHTWDEVARALLADAAC